MSRETPVTRRHICDGLRKLGVASGHTILVHSSLSAFGYVEGGADAVIDALLDAVGPEGTLMLPTHTWDRIDEDNPVFDYRQTSCCVGTIPETFWHREEALRGLHPTHSCAAIGPLAEQLLRDHETQVTCAGSKSPYQRLMRMNGKICFLGVTLHVNTTFHALEEMAVVPYLYDSFFQLYSIDRRGRRLSVPQRRHARRFERAFRAMESILQERGALRRGVIGDATVRVVDAQPMRDIVLPMLAEDPYCLLEPDLAERERRHHRRWHDGGG